MTRIAIADDKLNNRIILAGKLQRNQQFLEIVLQAANGEDFMEKMRRLPGDEHPHIVLIDIKMPVIDGVTAIASASSLYPGGEVCGTYNI